MPKRQQLSIDLPTERHKAKLSAAAQSIGFSNAQGLLKFIIAPFMNPSLQKCKANAKELLKK